MRSQLAITTTKNITIPNNAIIPVFFLNDLLVRVISRKKNIDTVKPIMPPLDRLMNRAADIVTTARDSNAIATISPLSKNRAILLLNGI